MTRLKRPLDAAARAALFLALAVGAPPAAAFAVELPPGVESFEVVIGTDKRPLTARAWHFAPEGADENSPVLFVMHGIRRDYDKYLATWIRYARKLDLIVVAPEFSKKDFPGLWRYRMGNVYSAAGRRKRRESWTFTAIERMFDELKERRKLTAERYDIWGHGAGGQFVHRMVLFNPEARVRRAFAANAGWYTMPDSAVELPFGVANAGLERLADSFAVELIVMLGARDNDPNHHRLNREAEAMAQGAHRLERGKNFYQAGKEKAAELNAEFRWKREIVPGAKHSRKAMAAATAKWMRRNE